MCRQASARSTSCSGKSTADAPLMNRNGQMTEALAAKTGTPCRGGVRPLSREEAERLQEQVKDWALLDDAHRFERTFRFHNFREALYFVTKVGELAESEGHHPDINFGWGYATVSLQ